MHKVFAWLVVIAVVGTSALVLSRQRAAQEQLNRQVGELRLQGDTLAQQRESNRRLAASLPSAAELDRLRADHAAISRLRAEIEAMRSRATAAAEQAKQADRFSAGSKVPASEWTNAGTATSKATLESVLWAAAGGDVETFSQCLLLPEGRARQQVLKLLESLPASLREQYGTPERFIALLAIKDVPLGAAQVVAWDDARRYPGSLQAQVQLSAPDGSAKDVTLRFAPNGAGWKLVVPDVAILKYTTALKGPSAMERVKPAKVGMVTVPATDGSR